MNRCNMISLLEPFHTTVNVKLSLSLTKYYAMMTYPVLTHHTVKT